MVRRGAVLIDRGLLSSYLGLKARIAAAVATPTSGFRPSQREISEGLAKTCQIDGETWTYATAPGGYAFTHPRRRFAVLIREDAAANAVFTAAELLDYLGAFTAHQRLNQFVVDNWLLRAAMQGLVEQVPERPGAWRLREP